MGVILIDLEERRLNENSRIGDRIDIVAVGWRIEMDKI